MEENNQLIERASPILTAVVLLLLLASCSPKLSNEELIHSSLHTAAELDNPSTISLDVDADSYYLIAVEQRGADIALGVTAGTSDHAVYNLPKWARSTESALVEMPADSTTLSIQISPLSVPDDGAVELTVTRLKQTTQDDLIRLQAEQAVTAFGEKTDSIQLEFWSPRLNRLKVACEQFMTLRLMDRSEQCLFNLAFGTYNYLQEWQQSQHLSQSLVDYLNDQKADPLFLIQAKILLAMTMAEQHREDSAESFGQRLQEAEQLVKAVNVDLKRNNALLDLAFNTNVIGYILLKDGRAAEAAAFFQVAIEQSAQARDFDLYLTATKNLANALRSSGQLQEASRIMERNIDALYQNPSSDLLKMELHSSIAPIYSTLGLWDKSIEHYTEALSFRDSIASDGAIRLMCGLTRAYLKSGNPNRARVYLDQALALLPQETNVRAISIALRTAAELEQSSGNYDRALQYMDQVLAQETSALLESDHQMKRAQLFNLMGQGQEALKAVDLALSAYQRSDKHSNAEFSARYRLMKAEVFLDSVSPRENEIKRLLDDAKHFLSELAIPSMNRKLDYLEARYLNSIGESDQALTKAFALRDRILSERFENQSSEYLSGFIAANQGALTLHLELSMQQLAKVDPDQDPERFNALSRDLFMAVTLIDRQQSLTTQRTPLSPSENEQLQNLERESRRLNYELTEVQYGEHLTYQRLISEIEEQNRAIDLLNRSSLARHDAFSSMEMAEIQQRLMPGHSILRYWLGEEHSIVWFINKDRVETELISDRQSLEQLARQVHQYSSRPSTGGTDKRLLELSNALLNPIFDKLAVNDVGGFNESEPSTLVIIPSGGLSTLSFASLVLNGERLIQHFDIIYLSDLSLADHRNFRTSQEASPSIAIYADPLYSQSPISSAGQNLAQRASLLAPLPGTRDEAELISEQFSSDNTMVRLGADANRTQFLNDPLEHFQFVHIASHAVVDPAYPAASTIMLSVYDEGGDKNAENAVLSTADIERLKLNADLVVLSACDTAIPQRFGLNTSSGLHQSFIRAGAAAVLGSSWRVADRTASDFMSRFYFQLIRQKRSPQASLAAVQRQQISSEKPLYDWAGWLLYTTPSTIFNHIK